MKIKFDYMNAADSRIEKGDYASALHYYFLQRNSDYFSDVDVAIGDVYMEIGDLNEATKYYMLAYANDNQNKDALEGLICCFKEFDEDIAIYYLHCIAMMDGDDFDFNPDELDLISDDFDKPKLSVHNKHDKEEVFNEAIEKLQTSDLEGGKALLYQIEKDDIQYCDARFALASLALDESDTPKAIEFAREALSVNPRHLGSHIIMAMASEVKGDMDQVEEWVKKIDKLNLTSEEDVTKIAMCFVNLRSDLALKYLKLKYGYSPYDKTTLMCLAALYSQTDKDKAIKFINKACSIYPCDVELKEVASRIYGGSFNMPVDLIRLRKEWHDKIKEIFLNKEVDVRSPENIRNIKWLLSGDNDLYLQAAVCTYITGIPEYEKIINETLLDPFTSEIVKKHILLRKFCDEKQKKADFVVGNIFRSIKIKHPKVPYNLKNAYYLVLSSLAIEELGRESALDRALKKVRMTFDCLDDRENLDMGALAVLLRKISSGGDEETYCKVYDVDPIKYRQTAQKLGF